MSRFTTPLSEERYNPRAILSLREDNEGGEVRQEVLETRRPQAYSQRELVILIHGFNNTLREGEEAYEAFRHGQEDTLVAHDKVTLEDMLGDCFWPGDAKWQGALDYLDFLIYPATIPKAKASGEALARYLAGRVDVATIHVVAHSMGCRVALETMKAMLLAGNEAQKVGKVCLMAASVPCFKVFPNGDLYEALQSAEYVRILYSPDDPVLSITLPAGQSIAAGDEGFFPTALGSYGDAPLSPGKIARTHIVGAQHGDYWGVPANISHQGAAHQVKEELASFLGIGKDFRTFAEAPIPSSRPDIVKREIAHMRTFGGHP